MCCGCSWKLVASWPQSLNQGVNIQLSGFSDLTRELIFDLLFGFCQIIVSWLQIILSPQKHCLLQMPLFFFSLKSILYFAQPSRIRIEYVKTAPLVWVCQQSFHLGCQDSVSLLQWNWRKKGGCVLWALFLQGPSCSALSSLCKCTLKCMEDEWFLEMSFPSIFTFVFLRNVWYTGKRPWLLEP